ncbi:unnamed protein product [Parnassius apollo]|uniref:(apollo) hypothetical protein n=1 Tax=Parnassius apollo TaxID=110799 RepID=A0A8S3XXL7_PARAO|nr:unnamed protein product [Parnassius apollo]
MSLEDTVVLSTVLDLRRNLSFDNVGSLDEIYLAKLAAIMLEKSTELQFRSRSEQIKAIVKRLGIKLEDLNTVLTRIEIERRKLRKYMTYRGKMRRKLRTVGRPKPYYLYELNKEVDHKRMEYTVDISSHFDKVSEEDFKVTNDQKKTIDASTDVGEFENSTQETSCLMQNSSEMFEEENVKSTKQSIDDEENSEISDKVIEDYFSNPETARELQESLLRMEKTMGEPFSKSFSTTVNPITPVKVMN